MIRIRVLVDDDERPQGAVEWSFPNVRPIGSDPILTIRPSIDLPDIPAREVLLREMMPALVGSVRVGLSFDAWPGEDGNHDIYTWQLVPRPFRGRS